MATYLALRFDPNIFSRRRRDHDNTNSYRIGAHHTFGPNSDLIASAIFDDTDHSTIVPNPLAPFSLQQNGQSVTFEIQHFFATNTFNITSGAGRYQIYGNQMLDFLGSTKTSLDGFGTNFYIYTRLYPLPNKLSLDLGLSYNNIHEVGVQRAELNPKFGLIWNPIPSTTIRAAAFKVVKRALTTNQTIEPTQVAGFNGFFDDISGTISKRFGIAIDHKFSKNLFAGTELSARDLKKVPLLTVGDFDWNERGARAYLYWAPLDWLSTALEYQFERFERSEIMPGEESFVDVETHRIPLGVRFFNSSGLTARVGLAYIQQSGIFVNPSNGALYSGSDQFWVADAALSYRLPKRLGLLSIEARNLFDERFQFQETDRANPTIARERLVFGTWTLSF
jgi:hypothetical protein